MSYVYEILEDYDMGVWFLDYGILNVDWMKKIMDDVLVLVLVLVFVLVEDLVEFVFEKFVFEEKVEEIVVEIINVFKYFSIMFFI